MKLRKTTRCGQTLLEFVVLFIILVAALLAMRKYIQRGVQGKWKESVEGMAKQYDPAGNVDVTYTMNSSADTIVDVVADQSGNFHTWRTDTTNMTENKIETTQFSDL